MYHIPPSPQRKQQYKKAVGGNKPLAKILIPAYTAKIKSSKRADANRDSATCLMVWNGTDGCWHLMAQKLIADIETQMATKKERKKPAGLVDQPVLLPPLPDGI